MIPFKGKFSKLKQFTKGKHHSCGINMWARNTSTGILCDFEVYQGKKDKKDTSSVGVGPDVVVLLSLTLPQNEPKRLRCLSTEKYMLKIFSQLCFLWKIGRKRASTTLQL